MPVSRRAGSRDRGSAAIEAAMLVPVLVVLVALVVAAGRIRTADGAVAEASRDAARTASLNFTAGEAEYYGAMAGRQTLSDQGLQCSEAEPVTFPVVRMDSTPEQVGKVTAKVTCTISLANLLWKGVPLPGHMTVTDEFTAVVDIYRSQ
jgi:Flp pilus assembly protein TadG